MVEIYEKMDGMIREISDIMKIKKHVADVARINEILVARWKKDEYSHALLGSSPQSFLLLLKLPEIPCIKWSRQTCSKFR